MVVQDHLGGGVAAVAPVGPAARADQDGVVAQGYHLAAPQEADPTAGLAVGAQLQMHLLEGAVVVVVIPQHEVDRPGHGLLQHPQMLGELATVRQVARQQEGVEGLGLDLRQEGANLLARQEVQVQVGGPGQACHVPMEPPTPSLRRPVSPRSQSSRARRTTLKRPSRRVASHSESSSAS